MRKPGSKLRDAHQVTIAFSGSFAISYFYYFFLLNHLFCCYSSDHPREPQLKDKIGDACNVKLFSFRGGNDAAGLQWTSRRLPGVCCDAMPGSSFHATQSGFLRKKLIKASSSEPSGLPWNWIMRGHRFGYILQSFEVQYLVSSDSWGFQSWVSWVQCSGSFRGHPAIILFLLRLLGNLCMIFM